jgi:Transposase, Mutator family
MIGYGAQRLIELEVGGLTGAAHGDKSPERLVQRNGFRDRDWETRAGAVVLRIPKLAFADWPQVFGDPTMPIPSSTVSYTMPIASISAAKACAAVVQE